MRTKRKCQDCSYYYPLTDNARPTANCEPNEYGECPCEEDARRDWEDEERAVIERDMEHYLEDDVPSAERGDYSPSNPWNAPGMNVSDFI